MMVPVIPLALNAKLNSNSAMGSSSVPQFRDASERESTSNVSDPSGVELKLLPDRRMSNGNKRFSALRDT